MTPGLLIFAATYVLIAAQRLPFLRLNRPAASLLGAVAMVVLGVLPLRDAYAAIDFDVLVFLLGLMLIVGYLELGKFFDWAAEWILARRRVRRRGARVARGPLPAARRDHRGCGDGGSCSAGPGLCDRPRRMVTAAVLRFVVRRHARLRADRRSRLARRSRGASGAGRLALARGGGRERRDGHAVGPDLERPGRDLVAQHRAGHPQPGFDVARPRHELPLPGQPAPHRP